MHKHTTMTHRACQSVCLRRVFTAALFLCPSAGTGPDTTKNGPLSSYRQSARWAVGAPLWRQDHLAESCHDIRVDPAVQRACGRTGCAEPSTMARTLQASTTETVAQLERVSWYDLKRYGQT